MAADYEIKIKIKYESDKWSILLIIAIYNKNEIRTEKNILSWEAATIMEEGSPVPLRSWEPI